MVERLFEVRDGADDAVEYHLAGSDAVARPDGGVFGVGFVNVGQDGCELCPVVGDFEYVVLCLAYEVGFVAGRGGYVSRLVEPDGGSVASPAAPFGSLWRAECVVELLLELGGGAVGRGGV